MPDLPQTMRALVIDAPGAAPRVEDRPVPDARSRRGAGADRGLADQPVGPDDPAGALRHRLAFPLIPGLEGSGRVVARGDGLLARYLDGQPPVACVADKQGLWAEYAVTKAARCLALPEDMPLGPAAMSFVNPLTAVALVRTARRGRHWAAISTAGGGALGRMIEARAKQQGLKIINVVRRSEQAEEMRAGGVRHVLASDAADFDEELSGLCRQLRCRMAFDAVGGVDRALVEAMGRRSEVLVYGALAMEARDAQPRNDDLQGRDGAGLLADRLAHGAQFSPAAPDGAVGPQIPARRVCAKQGCGGLRPRAGAEALAAYTSAMSAGKVLIFAIGRERWAGVRSRQGGRRDLARHGQINGVEVHLPPT
jgi:NADPH2:quinone reductase